MSKKMFSGIIIICVLLIVSLIITGHFMRDKDPEPWTTIPQIDSSTARIPITTAIDGLLRDTYQMSGPKPMSSKTHGAWLNLADGTADILFTVAPTADEYQYFLDKKQQIEMKIFGYDGLVFILNGENPVISLTADEIRGIYSGKITNWTQISGGDDAPIDVYYRNPESGSQRLFEQLVWDGYEIPDFANLGFQEGNIEEVASVFNYRIYGGMEPIVEGVAENKYAIGFNIMSYIEDKFLNPAGYQSSSNTYNWDGYEYYTTRAVSLRTGPGPSYKRLGVAEKGTIFGEPLEKIPDARRGHKYRDKYWFKYEHEQFGEVWLASRLLSTRSVLRSKIKLLSINDYPPTTKNFASGDYPYVTTSIIAIRKNEPKDSPARRLFDWVDTNESRALIEQNSTLAVSFSEPFVYGGSIEKK